MMRYFAFEDDSFFRMFTKTPTTELSPIEGASQGKYLWFILENLMDDKDSYEVFVNQDFGYSTMISIITGRINRYISEASFYENGKRAQEIERIIDGCKGVSPREWHGGIILRVMDWQYELSGGNHQFVSDTQISSCQREQESQSACPIRKRMKGFQGNVAGIKADTE